MFLKPGNSKRDVVHTIVLHNSAGGSVTVEVYFRSYKSGSAVDYRLWRFSVHGHATEQIDASIALNTYQSNKDAIRVVGDAGINVLVTVASGAGLFLRGAATVPTGDRAEVPGRQPPELVVKARGTATLGPPDELAKGNARTEDRRCSSPT